MLTEEGKMPMTESADVFPGHIFTQNCKYESDQTAKQMSSRGNLMKAITAFKLHCAEK